MRQRVGGVQAGILSSFGMPAALPAQGSWLASSSWHFPTLPVLHCTQLNHARLNTLSTFYGVNFGGPNVNAGGACVTLLGVAAERCAAPQ
jgi:hypothetical protein